MVRTDILPFFQFMFALIMAFCPCRLFACDDDSATQSKQDPAIQVKQVIDAVGAVANQQIQREKIIQLLRKLKFLGSSSRNDKQREAIIAELNALHINFYISDNSTTFSQTKEINKILDGTSNIAFKQLTRAEVEEFKQALEKTKSSSSSNHTDKVVLAVNGNKSLSGANLINDHSTTFIQIQLSDLQNQKSGGDNVKGATHVVPVAGIRN